MFGKTPKFVDKDDINFITEHVIEETKEEIKKLEEQSEIKLELKEQENSKKVLIENFKGSDIPWLYKKY